MRIAGEGTAVVSVAITARFIPFNQTFDRNFHGFFMSTVLSSRCRSQAQVGVCRPLFGSGLHADWLGARNLLP